MVNIDLLIEEKRQEMYKYIEKYDIRDLRTLQISQELDELLNLKHNVAA